MKLKFRLEDIYRYLLTVILWRITFIAPLSWISSARIIANQISHICAVLIIVLLIMYAVLKMKHPELYDFLSILIIICAYLSYKTVGDETFLYATILIVLARPFNIEKTLRLYFKNMAIMMSAIVIVLLLGLTNDKVVDFTYATGHSLGTGHPNVIAALVLNMTFLAVILYLRNNPTRAIILSMVMSVIVYIITASRTSSILLLLFAVVYLLLLVLEKTKTQWLMNVLKLAMIAIVGFSVYMMLNNGQIVGVSDTNFYVRFLQANRIFKTYGIHLWGSDIAFISISEAAQTGVSPVILDNGYLRILLYYGLVAFGIFVCGIAMLIHKVGKQKNYVLLLMVALFLAGGLMEKTVYSIQLNFSLLLIMPSIKGAFENQI